jgi:hypothetical protein
MFGWVIAAGALLLLGYEGWKKFTSSNPSNGQPPAAPQTPQPTGFENPPKFLASPMHMLKGQRYRFWFRDGAFSPSFFASAHVYGSTSELPADWPNDMRAPQASTTKLGVGTWTGDTGEVDRPDGLLQVWPTMSTS